MQGKNDTKLLTVPVQAQVKFLPNPSLANLVQTSKNIYATFQPLLEVPKLLYSVTHSDLNAIHEVLKKDFNLVYKRFNLTNLSNQKFENINFYEYILGTKDIPLIELMVSAMPVEKEARLLKKLESQLRVSELLYQVVRCNHNEVRALLEKDIDLVLQEGIVIDCSGRLFRSISALQYAFWAYDEHMWKTLLDCVMKSQKSQELLPKCFAVYQAFCPEKQVPEEKGERAAFQGVCFELNGRPITEFHYDFDIRGPLQKQIDLFAAANITLGRPVGWKKIGVAAEMDTQWMEGVGSAQRLLPMHVVNEYCCPHRPFNPIPDFTINPGSSSQFYNYETQQFEDWFHIGSTLGDNFAISRGNYNRAGAFTEGSHAGIDLAALTSLFEVRQKAFINLKTESIESSPAEDQSVTFHTKSLV